MAEIAEDIFLKISTEINSLHYVNIFEEYVELIINNE